MKQKDLTRENRRIGDVVRVAEEKNREYEEDILPVGCWKIGYPEAEVVPEPFHVVGHHSIRTRLLGVGGRIGKKEKIT